MLIWWIVAGVVVVGACLAWAGLAPGWRLRRQIARLRRARELFHLRREYLEARFLSLAAQSGKPRGLEWADVDFQSGVKFARDRHTGDLRALIGVTISFRAIEGGGMEDVEAVGNLRAATAVFLYDADEWTTTGRVLFNLNPDQAIERYRSELETVDETREIV